MGELRDRIEIGDLPNYIGELVRGEAGCVLCFVGIVRPTGYDGSRVVELYYEAHDEVAKSEMDRIESEAIERYGVLGLKVVHKVGSARVGEPTFMVVVSSMHREEGFEALRHVVEEVKRMRGMWKKEVTEMGEYWVRELAKRRLARTPNAVAKG